MDDCIYVRGRYVSLSAIQKCPSKQHTEEAKVECSTPCLELATYLCPARHKHIEVRNLKFNSFTMMKAILGINH